MGRKRSRTRQYLCICAAGLIISLLAACAPFQTMLEEREGRAHLQRMELLVQQGKFESALQENQGVLALSPKSPPADAALFSMALIHVDHANPKRDYKKAFDFFTQLMKDFPQSPFVEESRIWAGLLEKNELSTERKGRAHLQRMELLVRQGDFEGALRENQSVLALSPKSPPADAALFSMGLIYVHFANPKTDYKKALNSFTRLRKEFPGSPFAEEAKVWIGVLETMEKALRVDMEINEKKKLLTR